MALGFPAALVGHHCFGTLKIVRYHPLILSMYHKQKKTLIRLRKLVKIMSAKEILFDFFSHILLKSQGNIGKEEGHCNACTVVNLW